MRRSLLIGDAVAFAALAGVILLRVAVDPLVGDALPFALTTGAIAAAVWTGGWRPAVVVAMLGYVACDYLFVQPRGRLHLGSAGDVAVLLAFVFTVAMLIGSGGKRCEGRKAAPAESARSCALPFAASATPSSRPTSRGGSPI